MSDTRLPTDLSVTHAFVVHFQADTAVEHGHLAGRGEHVVSGRTAAFQSLEILLAFVAEMLRQERERPTDTVV